MMLNCQKYVEAKQWLKKTIYGKQIIKIKNLNKILSAY